MGKKVFKRLKIVNIKEVQAADFTTSVVVTTKNNGGSQLEFDSQLDKEPHLKDCCIFFNLDLFKYLIGSTNYDILKANHIVLNFYSEMESLFKEQSTLRDVIEMKNNLQNRKLSNMFDWKTSKCGAEYWYKIFYAGVYGKRNNLVQ